MVLGRTISSHTCGFFRCLVGELLLGEPNIESTALQCGLPLHALFLVGVSGLTDVLRHTSNSLWTPLQQLRHFSWSKGFIDLV